MHHFGEVNNHNLCLIDQILNLGKQKLKSILKFSRYKRKQLNVTFKKICFGWKKNNE